MATLMAGDLRGRARSSTNRGNPGINVHTWPESGVLVQLRVLVNSRPGPFYPCPGLLVQTVYTQNYHVNMVRERKRLLSHRGSSRGGTLRRPTVEDIHPPCHCPHCHCFCHCPRSEHANPNKPSQFMEASSPAPFFGSTIFSFDSPLNHPRINAHISVMFIDEAVDEGSSSASPDFEPPRDAARAANLH